MRLALGDRLELAHELAVVAWELHGEVEAHLEACLREVPRSCARSASSCVAVGACVTHALDEGLGEPVLGAELDLLGDRAARVRGLLVYAVSEAVLPPPSSRYVLMPPAPLECRIYRACIYA